MVRKIIKGIGILILGIVVILGVLYIIPPKQEAINYQYINDPPAFALDSKVGWYTSEEGENYQVTWSKKGLQLNYFDTLRSNLKSLRLNAIDSLNFDTNGDPETIEATFSFSDSSRALNVNTSKTKLDLIKRDSLNYNQSEVEYFNGDIKLVGLLLEPIENPKSTAVVFIHGSGISDRDNFWYMYQADYLARNGYVVLLPDKRGCGKSFGEWHTASFDDFADDILSAIDFLKNNHSSVFNKIGVVGISQGSWISHLVNQKSNSLDFIIDVVGSSTTPNEQVRYEVMKDIESSGAPGWLASPISIVFAKRAKAKRKIWWEKNGGYDPIPSMAETKIPILKIFADDDKNVPVEESQKRIQQMLSKNSNIPLELKIFEGSGHGLMNRETEWIRNDYLAYINEWMSKL